MSNNLDINRIDVSTNLDASNRLHSVSFNHHGDKVQVDLKYDRNGFLQMMVFPRFMRLSALDIFKVISSKFIEVASVKDIPNVSSAFVSGGYDDIDGGETYDVLATIQGMGKLTCLDIRMFESGGVVDRDAMYLGIVIDGTVLEVNFSTLFTAIAGLTLTHSGISLNLYDTVNHDYSMSLNFDHSFRTSLRIYVRNDAAPLNTLDAAWNYAYEINS